MKAVVLAGGRSSRFGSDKALAVFRGKPLIRHAVSLATSASLDVCVIAGQGRDYSFLDCQVHRDREPHRGPLAGLIRAFELFPRERILALTCDMPFLTREDIERLLDPRWEDRGAVLYRLDPGAFQPFPGIYRSRGGGASPANTPESLSMQSFLRKVTDVVQVEITTSVGHFRNINRQDELELSGDGTALGLPTDRENGSGGHEPGPRTSRPGGASERLGRPAAGQVAEKG